MPRKNTPANTKVYKPTRVSGGTQVTCPDCGAQRGGNTLALALAMVRGHMIAMHGYSLGDGQ